MSDNKSLIKWTGIISVLMVISRIMGFLRETVIAYQFGTSSDTDAYLVAAMIPTILFMAFHEAIKTAFVPVYGEYHKQDSEGNVFAFTVQAVFAIILILLSIVLIWASPVIVRLIAPGLEGNTYSIAVVMTRIQMPGVFFMVLSGLFTGLLQTKKNYITPSLTGYPLNIIIILSALLFGTRYGIVALAWGTLFALASQALIQLPAVIKSGVFHKRLINWQHPGLKKMFVLMPPVLIGAAANELKSIVDRIFASLLTEGSIAALNFANRLYLLPATILLWAMLMVLYPTLVELNVEGKIESFKETFRQGLGLVIYSVFPMMTGLIVLSTPIVRVLFERGAFDAAATQSTAFALSFYSLGLLGLGIQLLIYRAFYALKDTKTPMYITIITVGLNVFFNWALIGPLQHGGIALGTALSINIGTVMLIYQISRKIGAFGGRKILDTFWKSGVASAVMGVALFLMLPAFTDGGLAVQAIKLAAVIGFGVILYIACSVILKVEQFGIAYSIAVKRIRK